MELPDLEQSVHQTYSPDQVRVVGLHRASDPTELVLDFQVQTGVTFSLLPDERNTLGQFAFPPGVDFPYPKDVVVDQNLTIRSIKNSFDADEMQALIDELLAE